jgi:hypothetical protein
MFQALYGKSVQVLTEAWAHNAVGVLTKSELGDDWIKITPFEKDTPIAKSVAGVQQVMHLRVTAIEAVFELTQD